MAEKGKKFNEKRRAERYLTGEAALRCHKCDSFAAFSTDIRTIESSHHVILDKT